MRQRLGEAFQAGQAGVVVVGDDDHIGVAQDPAQRLERGLAAPPAQVVA